MSREAARIAARWREIATVAFRTGAAVAESELDRLNAAYGEPDRHYHDIAHIDALLALSRDHRAALRDAIAVDLAIFYHDAVYDPRRADNEEASARLARTGLETLGLHEQRIVTIERYIRATSHTATAPVDSVPDSDLDYLLDFDLSVLAAAPAFYDAYARAIRQEYACYPDTAYAQGRIRVLRSLLALPALYRTPSLALLWEMRAKANLTRELDLFAQS